MNGLLAINALVAVIVGVITAIVSGRVLREAMSIHNPVLGIGVGALAGLGLASHEGGHMVALLLPFEALGIALVAMLCCMPFLKGKRGKDVKPMPPMPRDEHGMGDDPWEKELRRGGKLAARPGTRRRK